MMVLRRRRMALRDADFVAASCASVDARVGRIRAGRVLRVKSRAVGLGEVLIIFVLRHRASPSPISSSSERHRAGKKVAFETGLAPAAEVRPPKGYPRADVRRHLKTT